MTTRDSPAGSGYQGEADSRTQALNDTHNAESTALTTEEATRLGHARRRVAARHHTAYEKLRTIQATMAEHFPPWTDVPRLVGHADDDFHGIHEVWPARGDAESSHPQDPRLPLPGPAELSLPLSLAYPQEGSLLFETRESGDATMTGALNDIILRLFTTSPPGKIAFSIIDPVGLGQNFAGLMHLSDYEESLINRRIWTQRDQIDERLADLNEHIEKMIQMYLRDEFATISQYNAKAGSVAEKYLFLVVADFPAGFSETAAKRLQSIAVSGPRCGVFTVIHWDSRQPLPDGFAPDELRKTQPRA